MGRSFVYAVALFLFVAAAGCAPVVIAGGGVASYLFAVGTVEQHVAVAPEPLYQRAVEWARTYGEIKYAKDARRRLKFDYYSSTVWIEIVTLPNPQHSRIEITARNKSMMTEKSVAQTIFKYLIPDERFILDKPRWYDLDRSDPEPEEDNTSGGGG